MRDCYSLSCAKRASHWLAPLRAPFPGMWSNRRGSLNEIIPTERHRALSLFDSGQCPFRVGLVRAQGKVLISLGFAARNQNTFDRSECQQPAGCVRVDCGLRPSADRCEPRSADFSTGLLFNLQLIVSRRRHRSPATPPTTPLHNGEQQQ